MGRDKRNFVLLRVHRNSEPTPTTTVWERERWIAWRNRVTEEYGNKGVDLDERFLIARGGKRKMLALKQAWDNLVKED